MVVVKREEVFLEKPFESVILEIYTPFAEKSMRGFVGVVWFKTEQTAQFFELYQRLPTLQTHLFLSVPLDCSLIYPGGRVIIPQVYKTLLFGTTIVTFRIPVYFFTIEGDQ